MPSSLGKKCLLLVSLFFSSILGAKSTVAQVAGAATITTQPTNRTVTVGQTATFTAVISNGPCRSYWYINGVGSYGAFASTISYTIPNTTLAMNGWKVAVNLYDCGAAGTNLGNSQTAILTVNPGTAAPTITAQPVNQTVTAGQTPTFTVAASGTGPLSYQWLKNGAHIIGAASASYTTPATTATDSGSTFQGVVTNSAGSATSSAATLTVNTTSGAPVITQQPQSQTVQVGQSAIFTVAISNGPCRSLWTINGVGSYGTVGSTISYTIPNTTLAMNGWNVAVNLYGCGAAGANLGNSQTAILTVTSSTGTPAVTTEPANQTVTAGQKATFSVLAAGTAPLSYQWQKNGANISGATSSSYTTPATTSADNGSTFKVVVSNSVGSVTSNAATLTVNAVAPLGVSVTSPTNGASVSAAITVSGTASGSIAVTLVQLSVDNGSFSNASGTNTWSFSLDTTSLSNTTHTLTAKATDSSGNTATSSPVSITVNNSSGGPTSTVDWTTAHQTITGFGAATAFQCGSEDANGECNGNGNPWTTQELNLLYDQNLGIGLSLIRFKIEENGSFPYNTNILNAIAKGAKAWGAPWSPPASMKTNGSIKNGGSLEAASYQAWASQLVNYVAALKNTYGIPIYAISVQNEPDLAISYESAQYSAQQFHDFVLNNLCPTLQSVGLGNVKIMIAEQAHWQFDLATTTKNDAAANACVGIYAAHGYSSPASAFPVSTSQELWETEDSDLGAQDTSTSNGLTWAQKLHDYLTIANLNAWHYWWAVDSVTTTGQGLLNSHSGTLVIPARFYMIGQYTKFIRPGFVRIGATVSPVANTYISAYKNPTSSGHVVIVAINKGSSNANVTFQFSGFTAPSVTPYVSNGTLNLTQQSAISSTGGSFTYTLLPFSVTTFVTP